MSSFERYRADYLSDDDYRDLQQELLNNPKKGDTISGTGGLRKVRWTDQRRDKGKRSGTRIIYYWYVEGGQFWMFTLYDKDELTDLSREQKKIFRKVLNAELQARKST